VAVAALVASTWQIPEVAAPDLTEAYVMVTLPPPPDPAPAPREPERRAAEPQQQEVAQAPVPPPIQQPDPEQMTTPSPNPDDAASTDLSDLTPVTDPGTGSNPTTGQTGSGGNGDCVENCGPGGGEGDIAYPTPGMASPRVIERVMPLYPEPAKRARRTGRVIVKAVIDATGRVRDAEVLSRRLGFGLEESALKAVYQWRFEPARLGDRPMAVYFNLTVDFSLQ
jgi:protein TonB